MRPFAMHGADRDDERRVSAGLRETPQWDRGEIIPGAGIVIKLSAGFGPGLALVSLVGKNQRADLQPKAINC